MRVELILEAIDKATGPIRTVGRVLSETLGALDKNTSMARIKEAQAAALAAQQSAMVGLTGAIATSAAIAAPIKKAVEAYNSYEDSLTDVGLKADISGKKLKELGDGMRAQTRAVNMTSTDMMKGVDALMAGGVAVDVAEKITGPLAKAVVATKTKFDDLAKTAVSLVNNLKVVPEQVAAAIDIMHQTGKDGQFELKDMAQFFPKLGAQYAAMGQQGTRAVADLAAMLQVMRMNVGTAGEAVTNLQDLLMKIDKGPALKAMQDALEGAGAKDVRRRMAEAQKLGTVMETMHQLLQEATGGDMNKLKDIFSDKQAFGGAQALMQHWEKFLELREKALKAQGVVDQDFKTRMDLGIEKAKAFQVAMAELAVTVGELFAPTIGAMLQRMTDLLWKVNAWVQANPELALGIGKAAMAIGTLLVAMAGLKLVSAVLATGFWTLIGVVKGLLLPLRLAWAAFAGLFSGIAQGVAAAVASFGGWRVVLAALGSRLLGLVAGPLALLRSAFMAVGAAILSTPIGWIAAGVAALAAGAYLVYRNWDRIGPWFATLWAGIRSTAETAWNGLVDWLSGLGSRIGAALSSAWSGLTGAVSDALAAAFDAVSSVIGAKIEAIKSAFSFNPLEAIQSALEPVLSFVTEWGGKLLSAFTAIFGKVEAFVTGAIDKITAGFSKIGDVVSGIADFFSSAPKTPKIIDPAVLDASIAKTQELMAAVKAIAPAARQAVAEAETVLRAANFQSHGVAMMRTLAAGIRAGTGEAVAAVRDAVQKIRDHLPHSPAKTGPLSDLDRVRFSETLAGAITRGAPAALAAASTLAAGLSATLLSGPSFAAEGGAPFSRPAGGGGASGGGPVTVNLTLSTNLSGEAGDFVERLREALPDIAHELAEAIGAETTRRERTEY